MKKTQKEWPARLNECLFPFTDIVRIRDDSFRLVFSSSWTLAQRSVFSQLIVAISKIYLNQHRFFVFATFSILFCQYNVITCNRMYGKCIQQMLKVRMEILSDLFKIYSKILKIYFTKFFSDGLVDKCVVNDLFIFRKCEFYLQIYLNILQITITHCFALTEKPDNQNLCTFSPLYIMIKLV